MTKNKKGMMMMAVAMKMAMMTFASVLVMVMMLNVWARAKLSTKLVLTNKRKSCVTSVAEYFLTI